MRLGVGFLLGYVRVKVTVVVKGMKVILDQRDRMFSHHMEVCN